MLYHQKIFDSTAGWCFYTKTSVDASPLTSETTPSHTNNLVAGSHSVVAVSAGDAAPFWRWNGQDMTQFDAAEGDAGFTWGVSTWGGTFTGLSGIDTTPVLRCATPNVAPRINFLPIKASELPSPMPTRFSLVARMATPNANAVPVLICYWENSTHFFGAFRNTTTFTQMRRNNGAWTDMLAMQPAGPVPTDIHTPGEYCRLNAHVVPATPSSKPIVAVGLAAHNLVVPDKPHWHAGELQANYNASWLGLTHNPRVGIGARAWNNVAVNHVAFADIRLYALD